MTVVNIEQGMPTSEEAMRRLQSALRSAKAARAPAVKVVHGYGSSGKGGVIKSKIGGFLNEKKRQGLVSDYVPGEAFSAFDPRGRKAVDRVPSLARDRDYGRNNPGITIVLL